MISQRIGTSRSVLVAHPDYLARAGRPRTPAELAEHAALSFSLSPTPSRWTLTRGSKTETVRVRGPLQATSSLALKVALQQGLGLARMPLFVVGEELAKGSLVEVLPEWRSSDLGIFVMTTAREYLPRKTRAFVDFFKQRVGEPPYWEHGYPSRAPAPPKRPRRARKRA